jgi:hypothetical protein
MSPYGIPIIYWAGEKVLHLSVNLTVFADLMFTI